MVKTKRELDLEKAILERDTTILQIERESIVLKHILENSILVKNKAIKQVDKIISIIN